MDGEFLESEVIFKENNAPTERNSKTEDLKSRVPRNNEVKRKDGHKKRKNTDPVNVPDRSASGDRWFHFVEDSDELFSDDDGELVPPHVVVGRRVIDGKVAYSVCTGNGRTLKGRDLREVRNSILRMTGFLES